MEFGDDGKTMHQSSTVVLKRVKVSGTFLRKTFFEKVLADWRDNVADRNFRFVLTKALLNLRNFPLEVGTLTELKNVKGIGEYIAQKLESSWKSFCTNCNPTPRVNDVKCLKRGELLPFLQLDASSSIVSSEPQCMYNKTVCCVRKRSQTIALEQHENNIQQRKTSSSAVNSIDFEHGIDNCSNELPGYLQQLKKSDGLISPSTSNEPDVAISDRKISDVNAGYADHLQYSFSEQNSEVIMIVDNREKHDGRSACSVYNYLESQMDSKFELRNLSVGDYVWVLRSPSKVEVMLDYIVERKTFSDLSKSIREGRYEEQKARLLSIGIRNVVYVVEGTGVPDAAIEQALVTTHISNGFLLHKTSNAKETAQFLSIITNRLKDRATKANELRMTYEMFQQNAKKTQRLCVKDIFMRQLTVCPQMSATKAALIVSRFPSFLALTRHYRLSAEEDKEALISNTVPGIPLSLSIIFEPMLDLDLKLFSI